MGRPDDLQTADPLWPHFVEWELLNLPTTTTWLRGERFEAFKAGVEHAAAVHAGATLPEASDAGT